MKPRINPFTVAHKSYSSANPQENPFTVNYQLPSREEYPDEPSEHTIQVESEPPIVAEQFTPPSRQRIFAEEPRINPPQREPLIGDSIALQLGMLDAMDESFPQPQYSQNAIQEIPEIRHPMVQKQEPNKSPSEIPNEISVQHSKSHKKPSESIRSFKENNTQQVPQPSNQTSVFLNKSNLMQPVQPVNDQSLEKPSQHSLGTIPQYLQSPEPGLSQQQNSQFILPVNRSNGRKPIFQSSFIPHVEILHPQHIMNKEQLDRTSVKLQQDIVNREQELELNYDISRFRDIQHPTQSEQQLGIHREQPYIYCVVCNEFINSSKLRNHMMTCQRSEQEQFEITREMKLEKYDLRLEKMAYLLEQIVWQMRDFNPDSTRIRKLACYGVIVLGSIVTETHRVKMQRKCRDLRVVISLMEQYDQQVTFILQKALETATRKFELIQVFNDK